MFDVCVCILFHICVWTGFVKRIHVRVYIYMYNYLGSFIFLYFPILIVSVFSSLGDCAVDGVVMFSYLFY